MEKTRVRCEYWGLTDNRFNDLVNDYRRFTCSFSVRY